MTNNGDRPTLTVETVWYVVFDGLSDWECGLALAEINKAAGLSVRTCGLTDEPVVTAGGVTLRPDTPLVDVTPEGSALLLIPGGERFEREDDPPDLIALIRNFRDRQIPIAAICGAVLALARAGMLDDAPHTGNSRESLEAGAPHYRGGYQFRSAPAVTGGNVITASGVASVELAYEIIKLLGIYPPDQAEAWLKLFKDYELPE